jgi:hypothetical protein
MKKLDNIINGWKNFILKSEVTELIAVERAIKCVECRHAKNGFLTAFINDDLKQIKGVYCEKCKCPLSAKLRSENEKCPIGKW